MTAKLEKVWLNLDDWVLRFTSFCAGSTQVNEFEGSSYWYGGEKVWKHRGRRAYIDDGTVMKGMSGEQDCG